MVKQYVLIGPPGAGKSTVGEALAKELRVEFLDTDTEIERTTGRKIGDIFLEDGEDFFRKIEKEIVISALNGNSGVIALGGGSILNEEVFKLLKQHPNVIYLEVSISNAAPRVGFNQERPLLLGNPRQQWLSLMAARRDKYEELAKYRFTTDNKKPKKVVSEILEVAA